MSARSGPELRMEHDGSGYQVALYGPMGDLWCFLGTGKTEAAARKSAALKELGRLWKALPKAKRGKGICSQCGCTENKACRGGCAWTDSTETLCTACAEPEA